MKKVFNGIIIVALLALVGWGVYDISQKEVGIEVGEYAPDYTLTTLNGEMVSLSDFKGKKVVLNFWASWCPPCIAEMPQIQAFYQDFENKDVVVLAVNLTESEESIINVSNFIDAFGLTFPIVLDEKSKMAEIYQVRTIPTTFFLNEKGKIMQKWVGPLTYEQLELMVRELQ